MKSEQRLSFKQKSQPDGSRFLLRICRVLNLDKNEFVKVLSRICRWKKSPQWIKQSVKNLPGRQRAKKFGLMDRRSCRDETQKLCQIKKLLNFYRGETQKSRWIEYLLRNLSSWQRAEEKFLMDRESVEVTIEKRRKKVQQK